jgi:hypothetical protein
MLNELSAINLSSSGADPIHMFLGLLDPDPDLLVRGMYPDLDPAPDTDPDPSISKQKKFKKNLDSYRTAL